MALNEVHRTDWPVLDETWGSRWLRASVARGWIGPLADRDLHLDDPVTRGTLALLLAQIEGEHAGAGSRGHREPWSFRAQWRRKHRIGDRGIPRPGTATLSGSGGVRGGSAGSPTA
jgi:hypothetical protein